ncbi:unnamed protein product [Rotaria magnacalcarata]|uniref:Uncharacterized protein n=1 Tax=Rotaria magnacalcarata TaxID=392030 RepID=A0A814WVR6_9BILA|nr:unnamed protein product [Rotaria magnacalcarata]
MVSYPLSYNQYINYHGSVYPEMSRSLVLPVGYDRIFFDGMSSALTQAHPSALSAVRRVAGPIFGAVVFVIQMGLSIVNFIFDFIP